jgi:hypothetical protein
LKGLSGKKALFRTGAALFCFEKNKIAIISMSCHGFDGW